MNEGFLESLRLTNAYKNADVVRISSASKQESGTPTILNKRQLGKMFETALSQAGPQACIELCKIHDKASGFPYLETLLTYKAVRLRGRDLGIFLD